MLLTSGVLFIASVFIFIGGLCVFLFKYLPYIIDFFNSLVSSVSSASGLLPEWLLPWLAVVLVIAAFGFIVKIL